MRIKIPGQKKNYDSSTYLKVMCYIDDLITVSSICGNFNFINLSNSKIASKCGLTRFDSNGVLTMSNDFYGCLKGLESLGVLVKTDSPQIYIRATKYSIDKQLFLILYCILLTMNSLSKKQASTLQRKGIGDKLADLLADISAATYFEHTYSNKTFDKLINSSLNLLGSICRETMINNVNYIYTCNSYVHFYIDASNKGNYHPSYHIPLLDSNNNHRDSTPFYRDLNVSWFTNMYLSKRRNDSKEMEDYYENVLLKNNYLKPIIDELNKNYQKIEMQDIVIDKVLFYSIPGATIEKKKEILEDVVRYWIIKSCPFLNYVMDIVDSIKCVGDNYRMNPHITIAEISNQYSINGIKIHFSGRMTNDCCKLHKQENCVHYCESREYILKREGFDIEVDLHSSIFSITKSLNNHTPLNFEYDIKEKLENLKIRGTINGERRLLKRADFKGLCFYIYFGKDAATAYHFYKNRYNAKFHKILKQYDESLYNTVIEEILETYNFEKEKINKRVAAVSERDFYRIYECVQNETGGTQKYICNIFIIESAIMALTIKKLHEKGYKVKNVYDCIWCSSKEVDEQEIKSNIVKSATEVFIKYYELSSHQKPTILLSAISSPIVYEHMSC